MPATEQNLLKSADVKVGGVFKLELAGAPAPQGRRHLPTAEQTTPQVVVAEKHPEFAVLEVTCCCGHKLLVKCTYGTGRQGPAQQQENTVLDNNGIHQEN